MDLEEREEERESGRVKEKRERERRDRVKGKREREIPKKERRGDNIVKVQCTCILNLDTQCSH